MEKLIIQQCRDAAEDLCNQAKLTKGDNKKCLKH